MNFFPVYFNSTTKTVINHKFGLEKSFQEILCRIVNWIDESCGWIIELIESQYINISTYRPLLGSCFIKLPAELKSTEKELMNIENNAQRCFLWCHVRHINPAKCIQKELRKNIRSLLEKLNFLCQKKILVKLK